MKDTVKVRPLRPYEKIKLHRLKQLRRNTVNSRNARIILIDEVTNDTVAAGMVLAAR